MAELAWHPQRGPRGPWSDVDAFEYFSLGIGSRFGPRGYGVSWGQWNLLAGSRLMPADHHGLVFDVGVGMFGTLGGSSPDGVNGGFAGRVLFGWVF